MANAQTKPSGNLMVVYILAVIFFVAGLLTLFLWGIPSIQQSYASGHWPKTAGVITLSKEVKGTTTETSGQTQTQTTENTYGANLTYQYSVNGTSYTGDTLAIGKNIKEFYDEQSAKAILDRYPLGKNVDVFYDPAHPKTAVLETGTSADSFVAAGLGALFLILGVMLWIVGAAAAKKKQA